ncbi:MAG: glutaminase [Bacteroidales bacterium]|nr:glutaminase [Bacteroidales bacterium]
MDYKKILEDIYAEVKPLLNKGKVADYIPALSQVPIDKYGIVVRLNSGEEFCFGDYEENFSIQSISKLLTLTMAHTANTKILNKFVGVEPSGNPFNSLVQLEYEDGIPRNPFINAGALVITDNLISLNPDAKCQILNTFRDLSGNNNIQVDPVVEKSEQEHGYRNLALVNFMKSFGNIKNDVNKVVDVYFNHCSIAMNCLDLARTFSFLSNGGKSITGETITTVSQTKRINSIMLTCGTYDAVGKFVFEVGLPAKSGVGGGIVAVIPNQMTIAVWSPGLDKTGNSLVGTKALELFTTYCGNSIF